MSLVLWLIIGRIEIVASACQTGLHDGEVLIGQGEIDDQFGLIVAEERLQLLHIVGVHLCGLDVHRVAFSVDGLHQLVALLLAAACNHKLGENVCVLHYFKRSYCCDATGANHKYFAHFSSFFYDSFLSFCPRQS